MFDLVIIDARRSSSAPVAEPKCWSDLALSYIVSWSDSAEAIGGLVDGVPLLYELKYAYNEVYLGKSVRAEIGEGYSIEISIFDGSWAVSLIYGPAMSGETLFFKRASKSEALSWLGELITCTSFSLFMAGFNESYMDEYPISEYVKTWRFSR